MIMELLYKLQRLVWGPPLMILLLGTGAYLMILLKGMPIRNLPRAVRETLRSSSDNDKGGKGGDISAFSALCTELAATIGTGNIVGVVGAIMLGGPGALWWMFLSSVLGLATKLVESSLSVKYRKIGKDGHYLGGPMVTLTQEVFPYKRLGRFLSGGYCVLAVFCALGMGNMVQANSIAGSLEIAFGTERRLTGLLLMLLVLGVLWGGTKWVMGAATMLVPTMGILYMIGCAGILLMHHECIGNVIMGSLHAAINPRAVSGGLFGILRISMFDSMKWGVSRGIFSNEAGLGAAGISAAASKEKDWVRQGYVSMTGVFFDTMIICMITGLAFCVSGVMGMVNTGGLYLQNGDYVGEYDGVGLMIAAFEGTYGRFGVIILTVCIVLFAFATILGWGYQGERVFIFFCGESSAFVYRILYGITSFFGAFLTLEFIWSFSDVCNGLLALPNLVCVLMLSKGICKEIRDWK